MTDAEAHQCAERFWNRCDHSEGFPRSLDRAILWSVPLLVFRLPRLGVDVIREWLKERGIPIDLSMRERRLMGCLIARAGMGVVFIDGADPEDEQRYSVAHELAHFLLDYLWPREAAVAALGPAITPVLDGLREPMPGERLNAVLRGVRLGTYTHLINRDEAGWIQRAEALELEDRADRLALELLAPHRRVLSRVQNVRGDANTALVETLTRDFRLPADASARYASYLSGLRTPQSFKEWLGIGAASQKK